MHFTAIDLNGILGRAQSATSSPAVTCNICSKDGCMEG